MSKLDMEGRRLGELPRNNHRMQRKRTHQQSQKKNSQNILELIPSLDLYIGPEQVYEIE
jgi:hypothetical protein